MHYTRVSRGWVWAAAALAVFVQISPLHAATDSEFPAFSRRDFTPPALGPREPELKINFPGSATARGVPKGSAVVAILVDANGKALDYQLVGYTDRAFGAALLDHAHTLAFKPATLKRTAVPARFNVGYQFESSSAALSPMEASRQRFNQAGSALVYSAVAESKLDQPLEFTNVAVPRVPADYATEEGKPVKAFVTFYVDEEGRVHTPNVESAASARLIPGAIKAVRQWSFKPPVSAGKPVLVFTGRAVEFMPRNPEKPADHGAMPKTPVP